MAGDVEEAASEPAATLEETIDFEPVMAPSALQAAAADEGNQEAAASEEVVEPVSKSVSEPAPASLEKASAPEIKNNSASAAPASSTSVSAQTLRVPVDLLETLMTLVSELVLTRNQLLQMVRTSSEDSFKSPLQRLSQITSELQEGVMKTRMQPIGNAWSKLPRIVRDLALDLGKQIDLQMHGADTELDRQVLELIKDPLTHMVRNSADHGLETPDDRLAKGKPKNGTITLNAFHKGGHIIIEIADDGKGLDIDKITKKIIANGLASEVELAALAPQQIMQFIFKPGFSTSEQVTNVSGRGVGMDVVRTNIEKIGGSIELASELNQGSTFTIKIPLTLAIVAALIVEAGGERFAMPQIGVLELVRAGSRSEHRIEIIDGTPILRLRDQLLPLMSLSKLLGLADGADTDLESQDAHVIVSQVGTCLFGLIVDQVFDTEEIVVKPVAPILRNTGFFSGNTILGDGSVVMILDLNGLAGGLSTTSSAAHAAHANGRKAQDDDTHSLLIFMAGEGAPKAVPLSLVTRLEEIETSQIEYSGHQTLMQYRGALMPLTDVYGQPVSLGEQVKPVLVFSDVGKHMGLVVDEIIDIAEARIEIEIEASSEHVLGTAVIAGKATELLDVAHFVNGVFGGWFMTEETKAFEADSANGQAAGPKRLLMVDDSAFFRNMLSPLLEASGFKVTTASTGANALELRAQGERYDCILSDIEMPGMNGFEFAQACRDGGLWQDTPIVALTSHNTDQDVERGRKVGFSGYVGKLDRDTLLQTIAQCAAMVGERS